MSRLTAVRIVWGAVVTAMFFVSAARADDDKAPPLPFHCVEGYGGGAITPMAYLVNPGPTDNVFGKPAAALTFGNLGDKQLEAITVTETLWDRVELGYGADRIGLGILPCQVMHETGLDCGSGDVWVNNFNARFLLVKENTELAGIPLPALTFGIHAKVNEGIDQINNNLGGALTAIGFRHSYGTDFMLTATKKFAHVFGRPLIVSLGLRESEGAELGLLGFGDTYHATLEGNAVYLPYDRLAVGFEFRQKFDPYDTIPCTTVPGAFLVGPEDNWYAVEAGYICSKHATLCAGWGHLGNLVNTNANGSWLLQLKYEF